MSWPGVITPGTIDSNDNSTIVFQDAVGAIQFSSSELDAAIVVRRPHGSV